MPSKRNGNRHAPLTRNELAKMPAVAVARYLAYEPPFDEKAKLALVRAQERNQMRLQQYVELRRSAHAQQETSRVETAQSEPTTEVVNECINRLKASRIRVQQMKDADLHWLVEHQATSISAMVLKTVIRSATVFKEKIKAITRTADDHTRARSGDIYKVQRNLDPTLHPFERAREYTRALNAVKVERMMAKPFLAALSGHIDGIYCMAKHPTILDRLYSGSADGELRVWSLSQQATQYNAAAHKGFIRGLCAVPDTNRFISAGVDKTIKIWSTDNKETGQLGDPLVTYQGAYAFSAMDHHRNKKMFATAHVAVDIWDHQRSEPIQTFEWGVNSVNVVKFNQSETSVLASCADDRSIILHDIRMNTSISKLILTMKSNALCWNPMEPYIFTVANEDHNCYTFDMRKMERATNVLKDHVSAVLDLDYAPTGQELVTGAYDRTLRIYDVRKGHSRDVYYTKRMQRIWSVKYSMDSKYIVSGSDDGNIRLWKAMASEKLGPLSMREKAHIDYSVALKQKYQHLPEIKRISKHRHLPKSIKVATKLKRTMIDARKQKEDNFRKHSKPGTVPLENERSKHVLAIEQ